MGLCKSSGYTTPTPVPVAPLPVLPSLGRIGLFFVGITSLQGEICNQYLSYHRYLLHAVLICAGFVSILG